MTAPVCSHSPRPVTPRRAGHAHPPTLGLIGGGQLARMLAQAAIQLGCDVVVLERDGSCPASALARASVAGDPNDPAALLQLAALADVITLENEFVDADRLAELERAGHSLWPTASTLRIVQDKLWQKEALVAAGLPCPQFVNTPTPAAVAKAGRQFGWPMLLKKRRNGYDGKGNFTLHAATGIEAGWQRLSGDLHALYAETFCPFAKELAVMVCRGRDGRVVCYPVVETIQQDHICHMVKAPAAIAPETAARATAIARRAVEAVKGVGSFGVELFLLPDGEILINELAPRVHNSGHYTIEACVCSQFENHVRAALGWPLGSPAMRTPAAVMVNLLGASAGSGVPHGLTAGPREPGAHLHIYGKARSAVGRKMGHITALGSDLTAAQGIAQRAAHPLRFGDFA